MGKIVIPKNSASLDEVMGAMQIYYDAGDWLSNADFIQTYKNRIGIIGDDKDSSAYTKKTEIGAYYGYLEWEDINKTQSPRRITPRGRTFVDHYNAGNIDALHEDIMKSLEEVSFGRNNYACRSCDSDIEPPALFLRAMMDLGHLTNTEFAYLVYKMEYKGQHYTETVQEIKKKREGSADITLPDEAKKFSDPKPILILERWGVLSSQQNGRSKETNISATFLEKYKDRLRNLKIYNIDKDVINAVSHDVSVMGADDNEKKFRAWMTKQVTVKGTPCTASMISNNCSALKKVCLLMEIAEYPDLKSIFEIVDMDVFIEVKNIIQNHYDYEEVNKACGNGFLRTGFKWYEKFLNEVFTNETTNKQDLLEKFDFSISNITDGQNLIIYGTPGCGKSYYVEHTLLKDCSPENYIRTTFFQDYTNTDFVGQILPVVEEEKVTYKFHPGPFTLALEQAIKKPNERIALVIEELNRGSAASIFGDIFQLLDRKNGVSEYSINNVNIINYLKEKFEGKYTFDSIKLPGNISIYATMNTSDQNVFTLDTAFKRRWKFKKLLNKFESDHKFKDKYIPGANITWKTFVDKVNAHILNLSNTFNSEDKQLGVYFVSDKGMSDDFIDKDIRTESDIKNIEDFAYKVLEYLWADVAKFGRADWFEDDIKSLDDLVDKYKSRGIEVFKHDVFNK